MRDRRDVARRLATRGGEQLPPPERFNKLTLGHLAPAPDRAVLRDVVELIAGALLERTVWVAGALSAPARGAAFLAALFVHRARGDLLRTRRGAPAFALALLDMLVLALILCRPGSRHW